MTRFDLVVLGDVNMDYVVARSLPFSLSSVLENGLICWEDIEELPGGSGLNFCAFAAEAGYSSLMLGKVGTDSAGLTITDWLAAHGVGVPRRWTDASPTGKAIIMRDSAGIRLVVNNRDNANHSLSVADIEENAPALMSCLVVYVSGYCVSQPAMPRYRATLHAMASASSAAERPTVVFDVVPHRIYEQLSFDQFLECTRHAGIVISDVASMRRYLGLGSASEVIDEAMARETAESIARYYPRMMLRYGPSGCDHEILMDAAVGSLVHRSTGHRGIADKRGYGDRLALTALRSFFHVLPVVGTAQEPVLD